MMVKNIICLFVIYFKIHSMCCHEHFEDKFVEIDMNDNVGDIDDYEISSNRIKRQTDNGQTEGFGGMGVTMGCCQGIINPETLNPIMMQVRMECQQRVSQAMMGTSSPTSPSNTPAPSAFPFQLINTWRNSKSCTMTCMAQRFNLVRIYFLIAYMSLKTNC